MGSETRNLFRLVWKAESRWLKLDGQKYTQFKYLPISSCIFRLLWIKSTGLFPSYGLLYIRSFDHKFGPLVLYLFGPLDSVFGPSSSGSWRIMHVSMRQPLKKRRFIDRYRFIFTLPINSTTDINFKVLVWRPKLERHK